MPLLLRRRRFLVALCFLACMASCHRTSCESLNMAPLTSVGGYDLFEQIGAGAAGTVYRARHWESKEVVAVKVLHPEVARNPVVLKRFEQEYRITSKLDHPNIVRALEFSRSADGPFLVMEFVEGESLGTRLAREGQISEPEAVGLITQVAQGLQCAHEQGLLHRDVKPDNILITSAGQAKLTDLGLAKEVGSQTNLTRAGCGLGTPNFAAPEQFRDARNAGVRADVYSLAATLYMMVTGTLPFSGGNLIHVLTRKLRDDSPPPRALAPGLSERTDAVIRRAMSADPTLRPASCHQFLEELHGLAPLNVVGEPLPDREIVAPLEATDRGGRPLEATLPVHKGYARKVMGEALLVAGTALVAAVLAWFYLLR
jgi:serine/threonine protein kinase